MHPSRTGLPLLLALLAGACGERTEPAAPSFPDARLGLVAAGLDDLIPFLAPHTMIRETGRPETIHLSIAALDFSRVMDPFVLRIRTEGGSADNPVVGSVFLDGATLLGPAELATADAFDLRIPLGPASTLAVQLLGPPGSKLTAWIDAASQPPPTIMIASPVRGAMLMQGTADVSPVQISGEACHPAYPITWLVVNGAAITVAGDRLCEPFTVMQDSRWGLSIITAQAVNARGRTGGLAQAYLRSPAYFPAALVADPAARVPAAARGRLAQAVIDDGNRADADDLATLIETATDVLDLNAAVPGVLLDQVQPTIHYDCALFARDNFRTGFRVTKRGIVTFVGGGLALDARADALYSSTRVTDIDAPVSVFGAVNLECLGNPQATVNGDYSAGSVDAEEPLRLTVSPGVGPNVQGLGATVHLSAPAFDANFGLFDFIDALVNPMVNALMLVFEQNIEDAIGAHLQQQVPPVLETLFAGYTLPGDPVVNGVGLRSESALDHLGNGLGTLDLGAATQIRPATVPASPPASAFGPIRTGAAPPALNPTQYAAGLSDDVINQLLWSAWQAGAFDVADVGAFTGTAVPGATLALHATLPPVVMPGGGGAMVEAGLGDVRVTGTVDPAAYAVPGMILPPDPVPFEAFASVASGLSFSYDAAGHALAVTGTGAQVVLELGALPGFVDEAALAAALAPAVQAAVAKLLPEAVAAVPLPVLDLAGVGVTGAFLRFVGATVARANGYTLLSGNPR